MLTETEFRKLDRLSRTFLETFRREFPDLPHDEVSGIQLVVTIQPKHPDVGELAAWIDPGEVTVGIGPEFHTHFPTYMYHDLPEDEAERIISEQAVEYIRDIMADRVVLRMHAADGRLAWAQTYHLDHQPLAPEAIGVQQFVWSGPIRNQRSSA